MDIEIIEDNNKAITNAKRYLLSNTETQTGIDSIYRKVLRHDKEAALIVKAELQNLLERTIDQAFNRGQGFGKTVEVIKGNISGNNWKEEEVYTRKHGNYVGD